MAVTVPDSGEFNALANRVSQSESLLNAVVDIQTNHGVSIAALAARVASLEQTPTPEPEPDPPPPPPPPPDPDPLPPTTGRLIRKADFVYLGAFRLPAGTSDLDSYSYGGTALAYNPTNDSLFVIGHDWHQRVGEVKIPEIHNTGLSGLARGSPLQPLTAVHNRMPRWTLEGNVKVGGTLVADGRLIGTAYEYYDGEGGAIDSHWRFPGTTLSAAPEGLFRVGTLGGGYVGGYMGAIPSGWQAKLGGKYFTGQAGIAIVSRTSIGPGAFVFDPSTLSPVTAAITPLVFYPMPAGGGGPDDHPLAPNHTQNPVWNDTSTVRGAAFPEWTDSLLFFGRHGTGPFTYISGSGPSAPPYVLQVWAYNAADLERVKSGSLKAWEVKPYDIWQLSAPSNFSTEVGGVCWDEKNRRVFVSTQYAAPDGEAIVHVWKVT